MLSPRVVWISFLSLIYLEQQLHGGRHALQSTTPDNRYYYANDVGVRVTRNSPLMFEVKTCQDALIRLAETQDLQGNFYEVLLGAGGNSWSGIRNKCGSCYPSVSSAGSVLNCANFVTFWITWDDVGGIKVGTGSDSKSNTFLEFKDDKVPFEFHYIAIASYTGQTGDWKLLIDDAPRFISPFPDGSTEVSLHENITKGTTVFTLVAEDPENDSLTFDVIGDYNNVFQCDEAKIKLILEIDYESKQFYRVAIRANDGRNHVTVSMLITVIDVTDEPPEIVVEDIATIPEEVPPGTRIGLFYSVTDADVKDTLIFSINGTDASYFSINSSNGILTTNKRLDRDGLNGRSVLDQITLTVEDSGGYQSSVNLIMKVIDTNKNTTVCKQCVYTATVLENTTAESTTAVFLMSRNTVETWTLRTVCGVLTIGLVALTVLFVVKNYSSCLKTTPSAKLSARSTSCQPARRVFQVAPCPTTHASIQQKSHRSSAKTSYPSIESLALV